MSDLITFQPEPAPSSPAKRSAGDKIRFLSRGLGQVLITAGCVVLLFVVYEVWVTNVFAERANHHLQQKLAQEWQSGDDPLLPLPGARNPTLKDGTGIAELFLPRLGLDYHWAVVEGTSASDLGRGPGHYAGTALPGQVGNFAVAGHRVGKGEPFLNLDQLVSGDAVVVETKTWWYVYRVKGRPVGGDPQTDARDADGIPGRQIVDPGDSNVLLPVPDHPGARPTERLMTMTTCHPKFTATQRMIVHAVLVTRLPRTGTAMPASVTALYSEVKP